MGVLRLLLLMLPHRQLFCRFVAGSYDAFFFFFAGQSPGNHHGFCLSNNKEVELEIPAIGQAE